MRHVAAVFLAVVGVAVVGVGAATGSSGRTRHLAAASSDPSAKGFGTFSRGRDQFSFLASSASNGSGGSGFITVFDPGAQVYYDANVACLYVDPSTGNATIWGTITSTNTAGGTIGGSVELNIVPGSGTSTPPAGFGNYLFASPAPTACSAVTRPSASPIQAGLVTTSS